MALSSKWNLSDTFTATSLSWIALESPWGLLSKLNIQTLENVICRAKWHREISRGFNSFLLLVGLKTKKTTLY